MHIVMPFFVRIGSEVYLLFHYGYACTGTQKTTFGKLGTSFSTYDSWLSLKFTWIMLVY